LRNLIVLLAILAVTVACKSKKHAVTDAPVRIGTLLTDTTTVLKGDNINRKSWSHFSDKLSIDYTSDDGQEMSGTLSLRMRNDSILWFSVSVAFGIQVAKGIITQDSVLILDLYHKEYMRLGIKDLSAMLGASVSLRELQNLIVSNPIFDTLYYRKDTPTGGWFSATPPITNLLFTNSNGNIDSSVIADTEKNRQIKVVYDGEQRSGAFSVPNQMRLTAFGDKNTVRLQAAFTNPSDAAIPSYPFSIPPGFTPKK
jgi:hypothetical protein